VGQGTCSDGHSVDVVQQTAAELRGKEQDMHVQSNSAYSFASWLSHWGAQLAGNDPDKSERMLNSGGRSIAFHAHRAQHKDGLPRPIILLLVAALLITCLSVCCGGFGSWWDSDDDERMGPDPTLAAVEHYKSPWATAYRESTGKRREAIELLFKCNIITMPEFANYGVSRQHRDVEKCVSIGVEMLQEHSVPDWEAQWRQAQHRFEKLAAAADVHPPT